VDLPEVEYHRICDEITSPINFEDKEVKGYYPRIAQMLLALTPADRKKDLYRGKHVTELEAQIPNKCLSIADFSFGSSMFSSDIYLHLEVERGLANGIRQGCANTFTTLKDRIELIRDTNQVYRAYTLACNGKHLGIAKIVLDINSDDDNGPIHIYYFV